MNPTNAQLTDRDYSQFAELFKDEVLKLVPTITEFHDGHLYCSNPFDTEDQLIRFKQSYESSSLPRWLNNCHSLRQFVHRLTIIASFANYLRESGKTSLYLDEFQRHRDGTEENAS